MYKKVASQKNLPVKEFLVNVSSESFQTNLILGPQRRLFAVKKLLQGVLEIRCMLGERKNREFRNREYQGMVVRQVFEPLYSFKVYIWGLCNNCN